MTRFNIETKVLKQIAKKYTKKDFDETGGTKVTLVNDFIVKVSNGRVQFIEIDENIYCYSIIESLLSEEAKEKYHLEETVDGLIPFDSVDLFAKLVEIFLSSEVVSFLYSQEDNIIVMKTHGGTDKEVSYTTNALDKNKSYNLLRKADSFYNILLDQPYGFGKNEDSGEPENQFYFNSSFSIPTQRLDTLLKDGKTLETRMFFFSLKSDNVLSIESKSPKKTGIDNLVYNIPVNTENFVPVERAIGFGFTHIIQDLTGHVKFFYTETDNVFSSCVLRNESPGLKISALLNFTIPEAFGSMTEEEEEEEFSEETDTDFSQLDNISVEDDDGEGPGLEEDDDEDGF